MTADLRWYNAFQLFLRERIHPEKNKNNEKKIAQNRAEQSRKTMKTTSNSRSGNSNMQWQIVRKLPETNSQQPPTTDHRPTADHNSLKLDKSILVAPPLILHHPRHPHGLRHHSCPCPSAKRKSNILHPDRGPKTQMSLAGRSVMLFELDIAG